MNKITSIKEILRDIPILFLSVGLILFTQWIKGIKNPDALPITSNTLIGLLLLVLFASLALCLKFALNRLHIQFLDNFPVLGWVSVLSLILCLAFPKAIDYINAVDFLSITTPILAFAGISVANRLGDIKSISWKIAIVGVFVFVGTYLGSALISQIALQIAGKI